MKHTTAVAVSGGVDSLFALSRLHTVGPVLGLHARFLATSKAVSGLEKACAHLGVPLHVLDLQQPFETLVIQPFEQAWREGLTPNPCAACNAAVKFGLLLDAAEELGATHLATGHYVQRINHPLYGPVLHRSPDNTKDQSYFLALVAPERLNKAVFPLHDMRKSDVVASIQTQGLSVPVPGESQEICFIPDNDYRGFLLQRNSVVPTPGPVVLPSGQRIGTHKGLWAYTEGQRRGLNLPWSEPLYVLRKDCAANTLVVANKNALNSHACQTGKAVFHVQPSVWPQDLYVQTRYRQQAVKASVRASDAGLFIEFAEAQGPAVPGQLAVVYDAEGHVLAGALIQPSAALQ